MEKNIREKSDMKKTLGKSTIWKRRWKRYAREKYDMEKDAKERYDMEKDNREKNDMENDTREKYNMEKTLRKMRYGKRR